MIPFGPKLNTVFVSPRKALIWAGGIVLTAYCAVPSAEQTEREDAAHEVQVQAAKPAHANPWALDKR